MADVITPQNPFSPGNLNVRWKDIGDGTFAPFAAGLLFGWDSINGQPVRIAASPAGVLSVTTASGGGGGGIVQQGLRDAMAQAWLSRLQTAAGADYDARDRNWSITEIVPVSVASLPLPTGAATDASIVAVRDRLPSALVGGRLDVNIGAAISLPVTGTFWQATQPISAVALPLPSGAAQEHTGAASYHSVRITTGGAFIDPRDRNWTVTETVPVSGTFWQATQPISAVTLPLPTGAATDATLTVLDTDVKTLDTDLKTLDADLQKLDADVVRLQTPQPLGPFFQPEPLIWFARS